MLKCLTSKSFQYKRNEIKKGYIYESFICELQGRYHRKCHE